MTGRGGTGWEPYSTDNTNQTDAAARADGYIECSECGHVIEDTHDRGGCGAPGCGCAVSWTVKAIMAARRRIGLPGRYRNR